MIQSQVYRKIYAVLVFMLFIPKVIWAYMPESFRDIKGVNDSIPVELFYSDFDKNLDSLMRIWYVQESIGSDTLIATLDMDELSFVTELNDSIYIQRLSKIPSLVNLTYNNVVRSSILAYTTRKRDQMEVMLGLADYYFPMFEEIFDLYGLPLELKYLAVIESALNPRARSRVGATGIWQFMLATGRIYKLKVDTFVDERRDPVAATHAAAKFLNDLYNIYNDWVLAIAAYNCGAGNVNKAIKRSGGKTSYWDIYPYLPRETRGYVPLYIGATYAMNYYREHNFTPRYIDVPPVSDTIMVRKNVNLAQVSEVLDIPLQLLRDLNPQYSREILPGNTAPCALRLPASYSVKFIDMEDSIYRHKANVYLSNSFRAIEPVRSVASTANTAGKDRIVHTIRSGETLSTIAQRYGVTSGNIQAWNNLSSTRIIAGKNLVVYVAPNQAQTQSAATVNRATQPVTVTATETGNVTYHTVKSGDTVWGIARQYQGVSDNDILKWNNLSRNSKIQPGMKLKIMQ
jgi:membrane-bound lytic murein transglycosylase D